jgi:UDP-glucose 4-epimerase
MHICIVGGTGLLGSHIAIQLLAQGHTVTLYARNIDAVKAFTTMPGVTLVGGSFDDTARLAEVLAGHDVCISTVLQWGEGAVAMLDNDTRPSVALAQAAAQAGVGHFLYTSSTAALGEFRHDMHEEMISDPIDYYCATKRATELFLLGMTHKSTMRCNIVRPGYFFGLPALPGGRIHRGTIIEKIARAAKNNEPIEVMDRMGTQYCAVQDLAALFVALINSDKNRQIYFGLGKPWYANELIAQKAVELCGSSSEIVITPNTIEDRPKLFTLDKIKRDFGFEFDAWPTIEAYLQFLFDQNIV